MGATPSTLDLGILAGMVAALQPLFAQELGEGGSVHVRKALERVIESLREPLRGSEFEPLLKLFDDLIVTEIPLIVCLADLSNDEQWSDLERLLPPYARHCDSVVVDVGESDRIQVRFHARRKFTAPVDKQAVLAAFSDLVELLGPDGFTFVKGEFAIHEVERTFDVDNSDDDVQTTLMNLAKAGFIERVTQVHLVDEKHDLLCEQLLKVTLVVFGGNSVASLIEGHPLTERLRGTLPCVVALNNAPYYHVLEDILHAHFRAYAPLSLAAFLQITESCFVRTLGHSGVRSDNIDEFETCAGFLSACDEFDSNSLLNHARLVVARRRSMSALSAWWECFSRSLASRRLVDDFSLDVDCPHSSELEFPGDRAEPRE